MHAFHFSRPQVGGLRMGMQQSCLPLTQVSEAVPDSITSPSPQILPAVLNLDRRDATAFQPLPFHYIEIAHFLFTAGTDEALASGIFGDNLTRVSLGLQGCKDHAGYGASAATDALVLGLTYLWVAEIIANRCQRASNSVYCVPPPPMSPLPFRSRTSWSWYRRREWPRCWPACPPSREP